MFCKNRITLIGFLGKDAETRFTAQRLGPHSVFPRDQRELERQRLRRIQNANRVASDRGYMELAFGVKSFSLFEASSPRWTHIHRRRRTKLADLSPALTASWPDQIERNRPYDYRGDQPSRPR
jgi:hypothetical protein